MKPMNNQQRPNVRQAAMNRPTPRLKPVRRMHDDQFTRSVIGGVSNLTGFLQAWCWTRPRLYLLRSWPAMIGLGVCAALIACALLTPISRLVPRYKYAANKAIRDNDTDTAETMFRKVLSIEPRDHESRYGLALIAFEKNDHNRAFRLMRKLALETQYGPAHFWLASQLIEQSKERSLSAQEGTLLGFYLRQASIHDSKNSEANFLMGHYTYEAGEYAQADRYFNRTLRSHPESRLLLHDSLLKQGKPKPAQEVIHEAEKHYRTWAASHPTDVKNRLLWAQTVTMLGDVTAAMKILEEGVVLQPKEVEYHRPLTRLYLKKSDQLIADKNVTQGMPLLKQAVMLSPEFDEGIERLLEYATRKDSPCRDAALEIFRRMQSTVRPSSKLHIALARLALSNQDMREASVQFRRAWKLDPEDYRTANNLAWTLSQLDPPQLDEALLIAEQAAKASNGHQQHFEVIATRDQILNQMTSGDTQMIATEPQTSSIR